MTANSQSWRLTGEPYKHGLRLIGSCGTLMFSSREGGRTPALAAVATMREAPDWRSG